MYHKQNDLNRVKYDSILVGFYEIIRSNLSFLFLLSLPLICIRWQTGGETELN
jgi:hypothetical protein